VQKPRCPGEDSKHDCWGHRHQKCTGQVSKPWPTRRGNVIPRHEDEYFADTWCAIHLGLQLPSREAGKCGLARWLCLSLGVIGFECCPLPPRPAPPPCGKPHPSAPDKSQDCFLRGGPPAPDPLAHCTVARWCCIFRFRSSSRIRCVGSTEQVSLMRPGVLVEPPFGVWWPGTPSEKSLQCAARVSATTGGANIRVKVMESGAFITKKMASVDVHCRATPCDGCYVPHVVGPRW
jgi:hypothetical protein